MALVTGFIRFGWKPSAVGGADAGPAVSDTAACRLRLTSAMDVRDDFAIEVSAPGGAAIGALVMRFAGL
jgi:hypothetical protein